MISGFITRLAGVISWRSAEVCNFRGYRSARRGALLLTLYTVMACGVTSIAQDEGVVSREYPLKALFVYHFGTYIEWPSDTFSSDQGPFVIGVVGSTPIDETLRQIATTKTIGTHKIVVQQYNSVRDVKPCQILFIARSVPLDQQRLAIDSLKDHHVLTVGESPGFAASGGCINFLIDANKIRFEINVDATKTQQLKISSKLLAMAQNVLPSAKASR